MVNEYMGKDIKLTDGDVVFSNNQDFGFIIDTDNLKQAIINRLQTIKGEYYITAYGSSINDIFGKKNDELLLSELKGYIVECLLQEARIDSIDKLTLTFNESEDTINVNLTVIPINTINPLNLIFPIFLTA